MAKVWLCKVGSNLASGEQPYATVPLKACINELGIASGRFLVGLDSPPHFPKNIDDRLADFRGPQFVVVRIDATEAANSRLKPGFYGSPVLIDAAMETLRGLGTDMPVKQS
jgi:hypothetical protein